MIESKSFHVYLIFLIIKLPVIKVYILHRIYILYKIIYLDTKVTKKKKIFYKRNIY